MGKERIVLGNILTPQEFYILGGTPNFTLTTEKQWYIPNAVRRKDLTIEEVRRARREMGNFKSSVMAFMVELPGEMLVFSLEDINESAGKTLSDPRILGLWNKENETIVTAIDQNTGEVRDLTKEFYAKFRQIDLEGKLHLRPQSTGEGQNPSLGEENAGYRK